jgi:hypothetical protein
LKKGSILIERLAESQSNARNMKSTLLNSAMTRETLRILDRPADENEQNKRTLDL